jgi:hypothetical protein
MLATRLVQIRHVSGLLLEAESAIVRCDASHSYTSHAWSPFMAPQPPSGNGGETGAEVPSCSSGGGERAYCESVRSDCDGNQVLDQHH